MLNSDGRAGAFSGVARLRMAGSCTAFLIRPRPSPEAPVYALTAGHCALGAIGNEIVTAPPRFRGSLQFHYFTDTRERRMDVSVRDVAYATLKGLDIAILELDTTYPDLVAFGVRPLALASRMPDAGERIYTVGAPASGVAEDEDWLRRSDCNLEAVAQLAEGPWKFHDAWRMNCGGIAGGASGSPVLEAGGERVAGIVTTATTGIDYTSGDFACYTNRPCELVRDGARVILEKGYALPLAGLDGCFAANGRFNLRLFTCVLDPGVELTLRGVPPTAVRAGAVWNVGLSGAPHTHYRYKTGPEGTTDCRQDEGYGEVRTVAEAPIIREPLPQIPGRYLLCVLGGFGEIVDDRWQQPRYATFAHTSVDTAPPVLPPMWDVRETNAGYNVSLQYVIPELSDYRYKFGPVDSTDCSLMRDYFVYRRVPVTVPAGPGLSRFCIVAGDRVENFSQPTELLLGPGQPLPGGAVMSAGYEKGPVAPGALVSLFLAGTLRGGAYPALRLRDAAGNENRLNFTALGTQMNFPLPVGTAPGWAELFVDAPNPASLVLQIEPVAPGLFVTPARRAWGFAAVARRNFTISFTIGSCGGPNQCATAGFTLPATVALFSGGVAGESVDVVLPGIRLPAWVVGSTGFGNVSFALPATYPYRGLVPVRIEARGKRSNTAWIHIIDEGI